MRKANKPDDGVKNETKSLQGVVQGMQSARMMSANSKLKW